MTTRLGDILKRRALESFIGRTEEKTILLSLLEENGPLAVFVHGIGGIGKSSLLEAFSEEARARGAMVVHLDCRSMEPTERGFLNELSTSIGIEVGTPEEATERLGHLRQRVVLVLDTYELFRIMDTWLRQVFIPTLPGNVRVVLCGREAPVPAWLTSPQWQGLFRSIPLDSLREEDSLKLLSRAGVEGEHARKINRLVHGHPLALRLASSTLTERLASKLEQSAIQRIVEVLTQLYLSDVPDPLTRKALEAASVVRCATQSLLKAMLPDMTPQDVFERLRALPFVESGRDGLVIHDSVRESIAASLKASDPSAYRDYRRAAWHQLRTEVRSAGITELWRYTADMLYILENPGVREAYFPSGAHEYAVEPSRPEDGAAIEAIIDRHEGPEAAKALKTWWNHAPETFYVAHDIEGKVAGFMSMFDPSLINPDFLQEDPVLRGFCDHLLHNPVPKNQRVLFSRQWLALEHGDTAASPVSGAMFLDCKRMYMSMRPNLRRVYISLCDLSTFAPVFETLGFRFTTETKLDETLHHMGVLDMGPASVDGWLGGLVAAELGVEETSILDTAQAAATIMFLDIVGFSRNPNSRQKELVDSLTTEVTSNLSSLLNTPLETHVVAMPTGDGMALAFLHRPKQPWDISTIMSLIYRVKQWAKSKDISLRTGIHAGEVEFISDINNKANIVGDTINYTQRVMDAANPKQVLFSDTAFRQYIGSNNPSYSGLPYGPGCRAVFEGPFEVQAKHGMRMLVYKMTLDPSQDWLSNEDPVSKNTTSVEAT